MGITRGTKKGHIARAALESIALRSRDIILEMEKDANTKFHSLKVDGGAKKAILRNKKLGFVFHL